MNETHWSEDATEVFYYCDPKKAITCKKRDCFINGGKCDLTMNPEWGKGKVRSDYAGKGNKGKEI